MSFRDLGQTPIVLGHRGARREAPENTLEAFELAVRQGAAGVELDVRLDASREVVVFHDRTLERIHSDPRDIETVSTGELLALKVPTLASVLAWARSGKHLVNVELKRDVSSRLELVLRSVRATRGFEDLILFSSFDPLIVRLLSWLSPEAPVAWLVHDKQRIFRYAPGFRALGACGVNPELVTASDARIRSFKRRGAFVAVWTVNDRSEAERLARAGVDAIISDVPGEIVQALSG